MLEDKRYLFHKYKCKSCLKKKRCYNIEVDLNKLDQFASAQQVALRRFCSIPR